MASLRDSYLRVLLNATAILAVLLVSPETWLTRAEAQKTFPTPTAAVTALVEAVKSRATQQVFAILGPEMEGLITTRDAAQNEIDRQYFLDSSRIQKLEKEANNPNSIIVYLGEDEWPFPAPLVKTSTGWKFEGKAALEEIKDRNIGRNELGAIAACLADVEAELDYFSRDRTGDGYLQFAPKMNSTPGKTDGLYWSNAHGEDVSPVGPYAAQAAAAEANPTVPLSGYYFKILTAQGKSVVGGAHSYVVNGRMIAGFAMVAWPAEYRVTGVETMVVNQLGIVYQKDLGPDTPRIARAMTEYNPDSTWKKSEVE